MEIASLKISLMEMIRSGTAFFAFAKHAAEEILKDIIHAAAFEMKLLIAAVFSLESSIGRTGPALFERRMAELIVQFLFLRIRQNRIGLCDLLELLLCLLISRIHIRMIFLRQLPVCFLYLFFICIP